MLRKDYKILVNTIEEGSSVLDIGCGGGDFLQLLRSTKSCKVSGLEIDASKVAKCLEKGLSVIQGDADTDLKYYMHGESKLFDYVILANSLQVTKRPDEILKNVKSIADKILVSIPNFGYFKNRFYLMFKGEMPVTSHLSYQWYETPNIHFSTIKDFINLSLELGYKIDKAYYFNNSVESKPFNPEKSKLANIIGEEAVFVLSAAHSYGKNYSKF